MYVGEAAEHCFHILRGRHPFQYGPRVASTDSVPSPVFTYDPENGVYPDHFNDYVYPKNQTP